MTVRLPCHLFHPSTSANSNTAPLNQAFSLLRARSSNSTKARRRQLRPCLRPSRLTSSPGPEMAILSLRNSHSRGSRCLHCRPCGSLKWVSSSHRRRSPGPVPRAVPRQVARHPSAGSGSLGLGSGLAEVSKPVYHKDVEGDQVRWSRTTMSLSHWSMVLLSMASPGMGDETKVGIPSCTTQITIAVVFFQVEILSSSRSIAMCDDCSRLLK